MRSKNEFLNLIKIETTFFHMRSFTFGLLEYEVKMLTNTVRKVIELKFNSFSYSSPGENIIFSKLRKKAFNSNDEVTCLPI